MSKLERIDPLVIILSVAMFLVFAYLLTWSGKHPDLAQKSMFLLMFGVMGILGRFFWAFAFGEYIKISPNLPVSRAMLTAISAMFIVMAAGTIWGQIRPGMSLEFLAGTTITVQRAFFALAAISEELFFTWGVLLGGIALLSNRSLYFFETVKLPGELISLVGTCLLFALWHTAVYGTGAPLQLMFVYRFLFAGSYLLSGWIWGERYLGIAMLAHVSINLIATGAM